MDQVIAEKHLRKLRILVVPLDWGLGHATRCIPLIRALVDKNCAVWLAGEGYQKELLQKEFPDLPFLSLQGYRVKYAQSGVGLLLSMIRQTRKIISAIKKENEWLKKMATLHEFDAVISDNRYGLHHPSLHSVFITHQLTIKNPFGKWMENLLQKRNYKYINQFSECWVPDMESDNNLAGELSHPKKKPVAPLHYIGPLSRFHSAEKITKNNHLLVILSGPEPQRTILENKIVSEIAHYPFTATVVRGLPGMNTIIPSTGMIKFYNHLSAEELNAEMQQAEYVISRSGYSTVMDIIKLQKKSILIPTPGQTEQEYLARYLTDKKIILSVLQKNFSLMASLEKASSFAYQLPLSGLAELPEQVVSEMLASLRLS